MIYVYFILNAWSFLIFPCVKFYIIYYLKYKINSKLSKIYRHIYNI